MKKKNQGFTLAEIMIVLTVIGILSVILLPVAFNSTPDKNILKFKKANNTLSSVIRELATSGEYYAPGNIGILPNGDITEFEGITASRFLIHHIVGSTIYNATENIEYFCNAFSDIVSSKEKNCTTPAISSGDAVSMAGASNNYINSPNLYLSYIDIQCINRHYSTSDSIYITTGNDITFFGARAPLFIGKLNCSTLVGDSAYSDFCDENGFPAPDNIMCIDVDGAGPIKPFGYGIRADGKIAPGARATWWLSRDITKKETECCPKSLAEATSGTGTINLCDTNDTICP